MCLIKDEDKSVPGIHLNLDLSEPTWLSQQLSHIIKHENTRSNSIDLSSSMCRIIPMRSNSVDFSSSMSRSPESMEYSSSRFLSRSPESMEYASSRFLEKIDFHLPSDNMKNMDYSQSPPRTEEKGKKKGKDKKLHGIKKKISKFEQEHTSKTGHKPSLSDKMNNKDIKKLISEKVKIETSIQMKNEKKESKHNKNDNKKDFVNFGEIFGYPENLEDATGLYEKYRIQMKRMARRSSSVIAWESQSDLETIPEDREHPLTLASPPQRIILKVTLNGGTKEDKREYAATTSTAEEDAKIIGAHISMEELLAIQEQCKVERDAQRKLVKQFEREFEKETGRELTEKEKETRTQNYEEYKKTKGKVRLIDALLNKMFDNHGIDSKNVR